MTREDGSDEVSDPVGAASDLAEDAPALQRGNGLFADAADLCVGGVVAALPPLEFPAADRHPNVSPRRLVRAISPGRQPGGAQRLDDSGAAGGGQVVRGTGQRGRGPQPFASRELRCGRRSRPRSARRRPSSRATTGCVITCRNGSPGVSVVPTARSSPVRRRPRGRA